jgi:hypothetical protein
VKSRLAFIRIAASPDYLKLTETIALAVERR